LPLKIIGTGPEINKLKKLIKSPKIEILGFINSDDEVRRLYGGAKAFIFPQIEDFGLVAAEAQACGAPVIAFAGGGALEIVENNRSGVFFEEQTVANLTEAVKKVLQMDFDRELVSQYAQKFSTERFEAEFAGHVKGLMGWTKEL